MKHRLLADGELDQLATARRVNRPVGMKKTQHNAVGAVLQQEPSVTLHDGEVRLGIAKSSSARAHHHHDRDPHSLLRLNESAKRRRKPARRDGCTQLDAVSATALGGHAVVYGRGDDFQQDARQPTAPRFASKISPQVKLVECAPPEITARSSAKWYAGRDEEAAGGRGRTRLPADPGAPRWPIDPRAHAEPHAANRSVSRF